MSRSGHVLFDDLFGVYMAARLFGIAIDTLGVVLNRECGHPICTRAYYDWARGVTRCVGDGTVASGAVDEGRPVGLADAKYPWTCQRPRAESSLA